MSPVRNTLILRELPMGYTEEELEAILLDGPEAELLTGVKPDVNQTAYVSYQTEAAAQNVALWLRSQKFRGQLIRCAMKTETTQPSFFSGRAAFQPCWYQPDEDHDASFETFGGMPEFSDGSIVPSKAGFTPSSSSKGTVKGMGKNGKGLVFSSPTEFTSKGKGKGTAKGSKGGLPPGSNNIDFDTYGSDFVVHAEDLYGGWNTKDYFNPEDFDQESMDDFFEDVDEPAGYQQEYKKYSRADLMAICDRVQKLSKPSTYSRLEQDEADMNIFRREPCREWAPEVPDLRAEELEEMFAPISRKKKDKSGKGAKEGEKGGKGGKGGRERSPSRRHKGETEAEDGWREDWSWQESWWEEPWRGWQQSRPKWVEKSKLDKAREVWEEAEEKEKMAWEMWERERRKEDWNREQSGDIRWVPKASLAGNPSAPDDGKRKGGEDQIVAAAAMPEDESFSHTKASRPGATAGRGAAAALLTRQGALSRSGPEQEPALPSDTR